MLRYLMKYFFSKNCNTQVDRSKQLRKNIRPLILSSSGSLTKTYLLWPYENNHVIIALYAQVVISIREDIAANAFAHD